jgi:hypothetical protein
MESAIRIQAGAEAKVILTHLVIIEEEHESGNTHFEVRY